MTKKEMYTKAIEAVRLADENALIEEGVGDEIINGLTHEIELIAKRASRPKKPTKRQTENEQLREVLAGIMVNGKRYRAGELATMLSADIGSEVSTSRTSGLLKDTNLFTVTYDKRITYYSVKED